MISDRALLNEALKARKNAYSPYSEYRVGAALLCENGKVYTGCNMENASYSATLCAERSAFASAISAGERSFLAIAVVGGKEESADEAASPCGICRQVMAEFCKKDFKIILGNEDAIQIYSLSDLLPLAFSLEENK